MDIECRKCHGTGEFLNGTCWDCGGSGTHKEVRYQTVPANESSHPALRAERELKEDPFIPADPEHVELLLGDLKNLLKTEEVVDTETPSTAMPSCEHKFTKGRFGDMCYECGMFEQQYFYSLMIEPSVEERL